MKRFLVLSLLATVLLACSDKRHKTDLVADKSHNGLTIIRVTDTFEKYQQEYHVIAVVKNTSGEQFDNAMVTAEYFDQAGDKVAESTDAVKKPLAPGDIATTDNSHAFYAYKDLPYRVKVSVKDMFK